MASGWDGSVLCQREACRWQLVAVGKAGGREKQCGQREPERAADLGFPRILSWFYMSAVYELSPIHMLKGRETDLEAEGGAGDKWRSKNARLDLNNAVG